MFRDLLAIETAALRRDAKAFDASASMQAGAPDAADPAASMARERAGQALPLCPGIWALRSPV